MDMNDRALRFIEINTSGVAKDFKRVDGFDITVASEVMAIFCLAKDLNDLEKKIGNITIAYNKEGQPIFAKDLNAHGPMTVLLKEAIRPNVTQSLEHNPAIIHGGPFANIAHGCNSVIATTAALKLSDYVVTEAGFGADLGAEKFLNIKCRKAGLKPSCVVIVATIRALKMHGGVEKENLKIEDTNSLKKGLVNLERHISNIKKFGLEPIVAINHFALDTKKEIDVVLNFCKDMNVQVSECKHWAMGGRGTTDLAKKVVKTCKDSKKSNFKVLYEDNLNLRDKIEKIVKEIYRGNSVIVIYRKDQEFVLQDVIPKKNNGKTNYNLIIASQPYRSRVSAEKKVKYVIEPMIKSLAKKGKLVVVHACGEDPANKIIKKIWPKENPFPYLYSSIEKYIKSNKDKTFLKTLKFHKVKKISYVLRALPNEISGGIATSLIFSAWNAAVYVNQISDEQIMKAEKHKNYQKVVQNIVNKYKGLHFKNELFVIEKK
mgnify:CR=1 FL=1